MVSRRNFLKRGTLSAVAAGVSLGVTDRVPGRTNADLSRSSDLDRAAFAAHLQTTFMVRFGSGLVPLKLVEVVDHGSRRDGQAVREAFALVFSSSSSAPLPQRTYVFEHPALGNFSLMMVPIFSVDRQVRFYEVNVNRLHG